MKIRAAFFFLNSDADETTNCVISTSSMDLYVVGCSNYEEAIVLAKKYVKQGVRTFELSAGFGNEGTARVQSAVGLDVTVGAVKFDCNPILGFRSGDRFF